MKKTCFKDERILKDKWIKCERKSIEKFKKLEEMKIPKEIKYEEIKGLSNIAISGLTYAVPETIGQASRTSGVTHNDIALLIAFMRIKQG